MAERDTLEVAPNNAEAVSKSVIGRSVVRGCVRCRHSWSGSWAQFRPGSLYAEFPGGKGWVAGHGAFNEHLIRDLGGLNWHSLP